MTATTGGTQYTWTAQIRLVSINTDAVKFEIEWSRSDDTGGNTHAAGDARTITLRPGERHALDLVNTSSKGIANLTLQAEVQRVADPALADAGLSYDVWLVHETASGQRITRRLNPTGRLGEVAPFAFAPLSFPVDANQPIDGTNGPVKMTVSGTVFGWLRSDGTVEVAVHPAMSVGTGTPTGPRGGSGGSKTFTAKLDETTSIEVPAPSGSMGWRDANQVPAAPRPGVTVSNSNINVDETKFFAGSKTAIVITVHRQQ
jgi:hypothetical protein